MYYETSDIQKLYCTELSASVNMYRRGNRNAAESIICSIAERVASNCNCEKEIVITKDLIFWYLFEQWYKARKIPYKVKSKNFTLCYGNNIRLKNKIYSIFTKECQRLLYLYEERYIDEATFLYELVETMHVETEVFDTDKIWVDVKAAPFNNDKILEYVKGVLGEYGIKVKHNNK